MIMMTNTSLPGIGMFTVRVFFYGDGTLARGSTGRGRSHVGHIE